MVVVVSKFRVKAEWVRFVGLVGSALSGYSVEGDGDEVVGGAVLVDAVVGGNVLAGAVVVDGVLEEEGGGGVVVVVDESERGGGVGARRGGAVQYDERSFTKR